MLSRFVRPATILILTLTAACSTVTPSVPTQSYAAPMASSMDSIVASGTGGLIYAANYKPGTVEGYDRSGSAQKPIRHISGLDQPQNMTVDANGNLYVANTSGNDVLVYHRGQTTPYLTLSDPGQLPVSVAVGRDGTVYVASILNTVSNPGEIAVYPPGATTPARTVYDGYAREIFDVAVDANGDCYLSYYMEGGNGGFVDEYLGCKQTQWPVLLTGVFTHYPAGIALDGKRNLIAVDQGAAQIDIFAPPYQSAATSTISVPGKPLYVRLSADQRFIYVANVKTNAIEVRSYPSGTLVDTITAGIVGGQLSGVAVDPAFIP